MFFILKITTARGTHGGLLPNLIASIFYVHNPIFGRPSDIDFVAWSLEIEIQFYILAAVLGWLFAIGQDPPPGGPSWQLRCCSQLREQPRSSHPPLQLSLLAYAQYFLAGFLLVEYYLDRGERRKNWLWDFVSVAAVSSLLFLLVRGAGRLEWTIPWLILVALYCAFRGVAINRFVTNPWIATIGGMCYTIYLLHNYSIAALGMVTECSQPDRSIRCPASYPVPCDNASCACNQRAVFSLHRASLHAPRSAQQLRSAFLRIKSRRFLAWTTW